MFGEDSAVVGVEGALLLGHTLSLGIAGYGATSSEPDDAQGRSRRWETGYGGLTVHYSLIFEDLPVYVTVGALVGGGAIELSRKGEFDRSSAEDASVVVQADVTLNANLTEWMRLGITAGYRATAGVGGSGFEETDPNGVILGGRVQFGSF